MRMEEDVVAQVALTAMEKLGGTGCVLLVTGGSHHGAAAVLCEPKEAEFIADVLRKTLEMVELAAADYAKNQHH